MGTISGKLTVCFDDPFWVGVFERTEDGMLSVSKVTFGAEPKDYEVYQFVLKHFFDLRFSSSVAVKMTEKKPNPKRVQRSIKKQLQNKGIGTKSQQALKLQQEQNKQVRKTESREHRLAEEERLFRLKQQKKKDKHRGH